MYACQLPKQANQNLVGSSTLTLNVFKFWAERLELSYGFHIFCVHEEAFRAENEALVFHMYRAQFIQIKLLELSI